MPQSGNPARPSDLGGKQIRTRRKAGQPEPVLSDGWLTASADKVRLARTGIKPRGGGPHQSKTMMLAELTTLLGSRVSDGPAEAIVQNNLLGKPSVRAREAAVYRLQQLYGICETCPICAVLHRLWERDTPGRPLLALLCALARDPSLRAGASAVLDASLGETVQWPVIASAFEARHPGRLGEKMAKSLAQNAASSWTQSGFLEGAVRKCRIRVKPTPTVAAYAALIASLCGFGGERLIECRWLDVLDRPTEERLALLRQAEGLGLARVRSVGDVLEIDVRHPMANTLRVQEGQLLRNCSEAFRKRLAVPWRADEPPAGRVWMLWYDKTYERRVRGRLGEFRLATEQSGQG